MNLSINNPIKKIEEKSLKSIGTEQVILSSDLDCWLVNRLKDNVRAIETINNSRIKRPKEGKIDQLFEDLNGQQDCSKKIVMGQIVNKLDSALYQSRTCLQNLRGYWSESKDMEEKIKAFENMLREVKQTNLQTHNQLIKMKSQVDSQMNSNVLKPEKIQKQEIKAYNFHKNPTIQTNYKYDLQCQYVYPKYLKPQANKRRSINICIQPKCRGFCKCNR